MQDVLLRPDVGNCITQEKQLPYQLEYQKNTCLVPRTTCCFMIMIALLPSFTSFRKGLANHLRVIQQISQQLSTPLWNSARNLLFARWCSDSDGNMRGLKLDWFCRLAVVICSGGLWMSLEANMSMKPFVHFVPCGAFSLAVPVVSTNLHMSCPKLPVCCVFRTYFFHDPFHVLFHDFNDHLKKGAKSALFPKKPTKFNPQCSSESVARKRR